MILIDTGPLVAMLNRRDRFFSWVREQLAFLNPPFHTCESVISESCFLLQQGKINPSPIFDLLSRKLILISFDLQKEHDSVSALIDKYSDLPMDLADGCLVRMAEKEPEATVMTLDSDFLIYRKSNRQIIPTLIPDQIRKRRRRPRRH
ncbi:pilus assembly protein [bacterium]|nr:pilus assembly protein [bacterium]